VPRSAHAIWKPGDDRPDPIALLEESSQNRLQSLVPIRFGRMLRSPFAFLRGAAIVMAADLATTPTTGLQVQACGDCHLSNFGGYGTPERNLVFDVNDFDETLPAPWEWDVKRLVASMVVAGRAIKASDRHNEMFAQATMRAYREHMQNYAQMAPLDVWYSRIEIDSLLQFIKNPKTQKRIQQGVEKARELTPVLELSRLTEVVNGQRQFIEKPPLVQHLPPRDDLKDEIITAFQSYQKTLRDDLHVLLDRYHLVDLVMKVVGVGSVGTRCGVLLLLGDNDAPLFLQVKEVCASVLEPYAGKSKYLHHGQRVVMGQRLMQAASDLFLGWTRSATGHDFYLRQLRDMKFSVVVEDLTPDDLMGYANLCGWALARAHARSGDPVAIAAYLGKKDVMDQAIGKFAIAYADQTEQDYKALQIAVKSGRIQAASE